MLLHNAVTLGAPARLSITSIDLPSPFPHTNKAALAKTLREIGPEPKSEDYEALQGSRIENYPIVRNELFRQPWHKGVFDPIEVLMADNRKILPHILGKASGQWMGYVLHKMWAFDLGDNLRLVLLVSQQGAAMEATNEKAAELAIPLLKDLARKLDQYRKKHDFNI